MRSIGKYRTVAFASAVAMAALSCSEAPTSTSAVEAETAGLQFSANVTGTPISTLAIEVTAMDISEPLAFNLEVVAEQAAGTLQVPVGAARNFEVRAFDTDGEVTHHGSKSVNVNRGNNPPLSIPLRPVAGEIEITISMGDYSVVVEPASALLLEGETRDLDAIITDPDGDPVGDSPKWATLNPAIASVDADGVVSAVGFGTVDIVATFNGYAGKSVVTVSATPLQTWFLDADGDLYGDPGTSIESTTQPEDYVLNHDDCDDTDPSVNPDAVEIDGDGIDNDCDDLIDEGF